MRLWFDTCLQPCYRKFPPERAKIAAFVYRYNWQNSTLERVWQNKKDPSEAKRILKILQGRFGKHGNNHLFKKLSERLEGLRDKAEKGLINSIEFIKQLCELAKETLQAEKQTEPEVIQKSAKAALTELSLEMKTDQTPAIVESIVTDIDDIVRIVRFDGWQNSTTGEKLVGKELRKILRVKYQIKDEELYNRAYEYIKEYY